LRYFSLLADLLVAPAFAAVPPVDRVAALAYPELGREVFLGVAGRAAVGAVDVTEEPGPLVAPAAPRRPAVATGAEFFGELDVGAIFRQVPVIVALEAFDVFESHFNFGFRVNSPLWYRLKPRKFSNLDT
jgi:hypothetical protein